MRKTHWFCINMEAIGDLRLQLWWNGFRTESRLEPVRRQCEGNSVVGLVNLALKGRGFGLDIVKER